MRNRAIRGCLIAFATVALATLSVNAEQPEPSKSNKGNPGATQSQHPSEKPVPELEKSTPFIATNNKESSSNHQSASDTQNYEWLSKLFNDLKITYVLLTLFTAALAVYTYRLWRSTEKLWEAEADRRC